MLAALVFFIVVQYPDGLWGVVGEGTSQKAPLHDLIESHCSSAAAAAAPPRIDILHEGARVFVTCEAK